MCVNYPVLGSGSAGLGPVSTSLSAPSRRRLGSLLVLWLMARLRMCLGRALKMWQLPAGLLTAFSIAVTSAARALAKDEAAGRNQLHYIPYTSDLSLTAKQMFSDHINV